MWIYHAKKIFSWLECSCCCNTTKGEQILKQHQKIVPVNLRNCEKIFLKRIFNFLYMYNSSVWFIYDYMIIWVEPSSWLCTRRKVVSNWFSKNYISATALSMESNLLVRRISLYGAYPNSLSREEVTMIMKILMVIYNTTSNIHTNM